MAPGSLSSQDTICIFRPKIYTRTSGAPNVFIDNVYFFNNPKAIIKIVNGDSWGQYRTSAASIYLNNIEIVKENEFNQQVTVIEKALDITSEKNEIKVVMKGKPDSRITVEISFIYVYPLKSFPFDEETYLSDIRTVARNIARILPHHSISPAQTIRDIMASATTPDKKISINAVLNALGTPDPEMALAVQEIQTIVDKYAAHDEEMVIFHPKECLPINDYNTLVLYEPIEDESKVTELKGFDMGGNEITLSAGTIPTVPIIICATQLRRRFIQPAPAGANMALVR